MVNENRPILVIGAGMAGLTAARRLADAGRAVVVLDKGRSLGGRMATRLTEDGLSFDHGAQFVRAKGEGLSAQLSANGNAAVWSPRMDGDGRRMTVGVPAMNRLMAPVAAGLDVRLQTTVAAALKTQDGWAVETSAGPIEASAIVSCIPHVQALALFGEVDGVAAVLEPVRVAPCWTLMVAFKERVECKADVFREPSGDVAWIARNSSKPERPHGPDCLVMHASVAWSRQNLEREKIEVAGDLLALFRDVTGCTEHPLHLEAHRWRYAQTEVPLGASCLALPQERLWIAGDWCLGARVEAAFDSGMAAAEGVLEGNPADQV